MKQFSIKSILFAIILIFGLSLIPSQVDGASYSFREKDENTVDPNFWLQESEPQKKAVIYFFYGDGCPHCAAAKPILEALAEENPQIDMYSFELYYDEANREIFTKMAEAYGFQPMYVPTILVADRYWEGFSDSIAQEINTVIGACLSEGCVDKGSEILSAFISPTITDTIENTPESIPTPKEITETPVTAPTEVEDPPADPIAEIKIPFVGTIDLSEQSMLVSTILIAFVDGFNPCSIWVLTMLLTITLRTGSRKKILIIGLVFLFVTSLVYALFIAGLFTVFTVVSFVGWIRIVVALVSLFFGLVNLKDYFWFKEGLSFTIDDKNKPMLYKRMRKVMDAGNSFWGLIGGTVILAAGVSLVEFSCTAGFPVLWTNLLTSQQVSIPTFIGLLLVYMFVYNIIALGIFFAALFTLKSGRVEEKYGRILKLIGGVLMVTLAIVMVVKPSVMSDLGKSMIIFAIAFGATLLILLLHRVILPKFGIHIGSEEKPKSNSHKKSYAHKKK